MEWKNRTTYHNCPCCKKPLDGDIQRYPAKYNLPDRVIVTCRTPGCDMLYLTHTPENHLQVWQEKQESHLHSTRLLGTISEIPNEDC